MAWTLRARRCAPERGGGSADPGILSVSFEGVEGESLVTGLTEVALATGSACSSANGEPSYVLRALGRDRQLAQSTLRLSLGRATTEADIERALQAIGHEVRRLRHVAPEGFSQKIASNDPKLVKNTAQIELDILSKMTRRLFTELAGRGRLAGRAWGDSGRGSRRGQPDLGALSSPRRARHCEGCTFPGLGCPHTLAVMAWLTGRLPGREMSGLELGTPAAWAERSRYRSRNSAGCSWSKMRCKRVLRWSVSSVEY